MKFDNRPANLPIIIYYKGSLSILFTFTNTSDGSAYDLSEVTDAELVVMDRTREAQLTLVLSDGLTLDGAGGIITAQVSNTDVVALATQEYLYEMLITFSSGAVWPILDSTFCVTDDGQTDAGSAGPVTIRGGTITIDATVGEYAAGEFPANGVVLEDGSTYMVTETNSFIIQEA